MDLDEIKRFYKDQLGVFYDETIIDNLIKQKTKYVTGTHAGIIVNHGTIYNNSKQKDDNDNLRKENDMLKQHIIHLREYIEEIETQFSFHSDNSEK